eukprot:jgi/Astpho2/7971/Aster-06568
MLVDSELKAVVQLSEAGSLPQQIILLCCGLVALCCLCGFVASQLLAHKNQETWQTRQHQQGNALQQRPSAALPQASASRAASVPRPAAGAAAELDSPRGSTQQSDLGHSGLAVPMLESGLSPTPILQGPSVYRWASSEPGVKDEELRSLDSLPPGSSVDGQGFGGHATMQGVGASQLSEGGRVPWREDFLFAQGIVEGEHQVSWEDGGVYYGEWSAGRPHGRGIFVWPTGDRYEGEWQHGKESGTGTAQAPDGSTFYGYWVDGKRHGEGRETVLRVADKDAQRKALKAVAKEQKRTDRKASQKLLSAARLGEQVYKGHHSYDLMRNLQLGILFSIAKSGRLSPLGAKRSLDPSDFSMQVTQYFPRGPESSSFKWKDYCPTVFQRLRQMYGIDNKDYLLSLTGDRALRLLASPGKSGSVFFLSDDDRFMIKTMKHEEMRLLLELMPQYYSHVESNHNTLLTRFHAVHRVKPLGGQKVRFVVMGNVFPSDVKLHRRYDLKGSTFGRTAAKKAGNPNTVLKDLDVDLQLQLDPASYDGLMAQLESDCELLERLKVMDYSLLLGVHYLNWGDGTWHPPSVAAATIDSYACNARLLFPNLYAQAALHAALQLTLASAIPLIMPCYVKQQSRQISMACEPVLVYYGIIDFLQEYSMRKRMEHAMKATVFNGKAISVVDPHSYRVRFLHAMNSLFVRKN